MNLKALVGSGDKIMLLASPFLIVGLILNVMHPAWFGVGGPPAILKVISIALLVPGLVMWIWSIVLVLTRVPRHELITHGPYSLLKHPLYTSAALLVFPWFGFLLDTWLGALIGIVVYFGSRIFSPAEERDLAKTFGAAWDTYCRDVKIPWL